MNQKVAEDKQLGISMNWLTAMNKLSRCRDEISHKVILLFYLTKRGNLVRDGNRSEGVCETFSYTTRFSKWKIKGM